MAPPTTPECLVIFLIENLPIVCFCRPGHKKWTLWRYSKNHQVEVHNILGDAIIYNGKLYGITRVGDFCQLVIGPGELQFKLFTARLPLRSVLRKEQLVESCGELFIIRRKSIFDIEVYKMNFSQDIWENVFNLGSRSFVLIGDYSASFSATELNIMGNTIYFTKTDVDNESYLFVSDEKNSLFSFNLADKSLSVWRNHPDSGNLWISHDEMLSALRFPDKSRCYKQIVNKRENTQETTKCNENKSESIWFQLPADMQKLIVQHLPTVFDYMNLRAVCKNLRSLFLPIQWKPNQRGVPFKYPWLMFPQGEKGKYSFYDTIGNLMHSISISELEECEVRFSNQGWILATKSPTSIFFFEPFTRTRIQLPDLMVNYWYDGICFSDTPTSSNWQIFGIAHYYRKVMEIIYLRSGDEHWTYHRITSEILPNPSFSNPVFDGQYFCYLGRNGSLVLFKFTETNLDWFVESLSLNCDSSRRFLVCYENKLISLFLDQMGRSIHVFKLDRSVPEWVEIENMEKIVLYLSQTTSLVLEAMVQKVRNTIQFSMFSDIDNDCSNISYSFKNQKYQTYKRDQVYSSLSHLYDTKEFLHGTWIQPLVVPEMMMPAGCLF
ncbi:hypothetical protein REPUB_Repub17cG0165600 [Reevesia pubescens]